MKKFLSPICVAAVLATAPLFTGCALLNRDATTDQRAADVKALCFAAASIGTSIALEENHEVQPKFEIAYESLNKLVEQKVITGLLLRDVIASLPVKELKSPQARIAIDGATVLYTATVGDRLTIEQEPYVVAAATGIRDGMKAALGK